jgi:hypothetical protein
MTVTVKVLIPAKIAENYQTGCWEWTGFKNRDGYGIVHSKGKLLKAHRIAYCEANNKTLADIRGVVVRHKCDNRKCLNPEHLEIGTSADNTMDRHVRDRDAKGSRNGNAKLTESMVKEIRAIYKPRQRGCGHKDLAIKYQVSKSLIGQIVQMQIWAHV